MYEEEKEKERKKKEPIENLIRLGLYDQAEISSSKYCLELSIRKKECYWAIPIRWTFYDQGRDCLFWSYYAVGC